jgi:threo-3-hydroxy-L-aspartate ammonia-lyase
VITATDIARAAARIDDWTVRTPLLACPRLSESLGLDVRLKAENLQHTGSFKARGAFNALLSRREEGQSIAGVAAFSAGNHAMATAYAGRALGLPTVVCMPPHAVVTKIEAVRRWGGEVILTDDLLGTCRAVAAERGYQLLHPFNDPAVIAGQATVGAEIVASGFAPDVVLVPVGGGGLISGIAAAVKLALPDARVIGAEPVTANAMSHALRVGTAEPPPQRPQSMADGLAAPFAGELALEYVKSYVDSVVEVEESDIPAAWWEMLDQTKLLVEPSAAVPLAALRSGAVKIEPGQRVVFVISGGNTSPAALGALTA